MSKKIGVMSNTINRVGDLELEQNLTIQRRVCKVQRVSWAIMILVAIAALLGLSGRGVLSRTTTGESDAGLRLEYERFGRFHAQTMLRIQLGATASHAGKARVWFSRNYLEAVEIQRVTPEPDRVEAHSDRFIYVFDLPEPNQPTAITFFLEPDQIGSLPGQVGLGGRQPLTFRQFIYP